MVEKVRRNLQQMKNNSSVIIDEKRIKYVRFKLIKWWRSNDFDENIFPWRSNNISPYRALITEVLLQRTRSVSVKNVYDKFFEKFPDAEILSRSKIYEVKAIIDCLGFSFRTKNLIKLGSAITNGIPDNFEELVKLPNVGAYIAGAYLSLHRGIRAIIPDANMVRIIGRFFGFNLYAEMRKEKLFLELCEWITPMKNFREFNYGIIDYGRIICIPRTPKCSECILKFKCEFRLSRPFVSDG